MTDRKPRRAVFADVLLICDPIGIRERDDGTIDLDFASGAALQAWLVAAGLDGPDSHHVYTGEHNGRPYRSTIAHNTWRGREIYATAHEHPTVPDLTPDVCARLTTLAAA
ncbi:hypothetical protein [Virgisporangium aurantiacum]|uniref:Uncharacterized protein n=1 Tax=Virgisporangium aurantiacum TaxID=175570 RepID=A0A8J3Z105_9ACTN|nr:hypothetical protein [Virgisporangium aurantiacum]GIJ53225.1 hypothetical protein Vau01_007410 [Virgisporangium aurantiacum]